MSQNVSTAVMQRRVEPDDSLDDFPTPPWATRAVIHHIIRHRVSNLSNMTVREPACNRGYMAQPLTEYFNKVIATDIFNYGWAAMDEVVDYLFPGQLAPAEWTFTNPPFKLAHQFIERSFETPAWQGTAVIVRTSFLEGGDRYKELFSKRPPSIVAQHVERVIMTKGIVRDPAKEYWDPSANHGHGAMRRPSTATSYCWLIWRAGDNTGQTRMMWIPPCRKAMERPGDYPEVVTP